MTRIDPCASVLAGEELIEQMGLPFSMYARSLSAELRVVEIRFNENVAILGDYLKGKSITEER